MEKNTKTLTFAFIRIVIKPMRIPRILAGDSSKMQVGQVKVGIHGYPIVTTC